MGYGVRASFGLGRCGDGEGEEIGDFGTRDMALALRAAGGATRLYCLYNRCFSLGDCGTDGDFGGGGGGTSTIFWASWINSCASR